MAESWIRKIRDPRFIANFGIAGTVFLLLAFILPQFWFEGAEGQSYSMRNHFVSELGWYGTSEGAWVFSVGLVLGGFLMAIFSLGVGFQFRGIFPKFVALTSAGSAFFGALVGLVPVNVGVIIHCVVASGYFVGGFWATLGFTFLTLFERWRMPRAYRYFGFLVLAVYACILGINFPKDLMAHFDWSNLRIVNRPSVWYPAVVEWGIVVSTVLYLFSIALYFRFGKNENFRAK